MSTETEFTFGHRVRLAMDAAGLDPLNLAASADLSTKTVERYLDRPDPPNQRAGVKAVAEATGVGQRWLETGEGEMRVSASGDGSASAPPDRLVPGAIAAAPEPPLRPDHPEPYVDETGDYGVPGAAYVAVVNVTLCAGEGADASYEERVTGRVPYPLLWLRRFVGTLDGLRLVHVMGDSMPDFPANSEALVRVRTGFRGAGIYAIEQDGDLLIKRVNKLGGGVYVVASDNPAYPTDTLRPIKDSDSCAFRSELTDLVTTFAIAGKVVLSLKPV